MLSCGDDFSTVQEGGGVCRTPSDLKTKASGQTLAIALGAVEKAGGIYENNATEWFGKREN